MEDTKYESNTFRHRIRGMKSENINGELLAFEKRTSTIEVKFEELWIKLEASVIIRIDFTYVMYCLPQSKDILINSMPKETSAGFCVSNKLL